MWEIEGSRWYKTDLHLHTSASKCFIDSSVSAEHWVSRAIEQNLDCVAVTDHNTGHGIDEIKLAAKDTNLTVFPGVEVTCSDSKVHILVLFDLDKDGSYVNSFLSLCGIKPDQFGMENTKVKKTVMDVIKLAKEYEGIVIPAHIDQYNGLGDVDHTTITEVLGSVDGVQAVHKEFMNESDTESYSESVNSLYENEVTNDEIDKWNKAFKKALKLEKAFLTFSDNPAHEKSSKHGLWGIGKRYTWIKMDKIISLEGLRQALMMPELRIKNNFSKLNSPPENPNMWIHSLKIKDTKLNDGNAQTIDFNPNMTTIVGGRGTGKSSILRFIRGSFDKNDELKSYKDLYDDQNSFFQTEKNHSGESVGVLKNESQIELKFYRHENPYILQLNNFNGYAKNITLKELNEDSNEFKEINDFEIKSLLEMFDFDIYSQKQIYEIAKETNALRDKIDRSINGLGVLKEKSSSLIKSYSAMSIEIKKIENEIRQKSRIKTELKDLEAQFKKLTDGELQEVFSKTKKFTSEINTVKKIIKSIEENEVQIKQLKFNEILLDTSSFEKEDKDELENIILKFKEAQSKLEDEIQMIATEMEGLRTKTAKQFFETNWYENYKSNENKYEELKTKFGEETLSQLENIEELNEQIIETQGKLNIISQKEDSLETLKVEYQSLAQEYKQNRTEIYQRRVDFVEEVLRDTEQIKIKISKSRDLKNLELQIRSIIQKEGTFNKEIQNIVEYCNKGNIEKNIEQFIVKVHKVRNNEEDDLITGKFVGVIRGLNDEQISNLNLLLPEDDIKIEYKDSSNQWKSLSNASAGQKTSAILTFLLSYGDKPLILDQPEDDLDNFLIYDLIVERMKAIKKYRQIIIVTHNANIPVNGDSELVIAMNSKSNGIEKLVSGSIENPEIKDIICKIMEGGKDAFKLRAKRYNLN